MTYQEALSVLQLDDATLRVVREACSREKLPSDPETLHRWITASAESWTQNHPPGEAPYHAAGFLVAHFRRLHSLERRRRRASKSDRFVQEDRATFERLYQEHYDAAFDQLSHDLGPPPPHETAPHHGQLASDFLAHLRSTASKQALDTLSSREGPIGEIAARQAQARRPKAGGQASPLPERERQRASRLARFLAGHHEHLSPAGPVHPPGDEPL